MASSLNLTLKTIAYNDVSTPGNPLRRYFDWGRDYQGLVVSNPKTNSYQIPANSSLLLFSGTVSTSIGSNTQFTLSLSPLATNRYRFTHSSGTAPAFRTARTFSPNTKTYTWLMNGNSTSTLTSDTTGDFVNAQVSDILFVPGLLSGDSASPFNSLNEGYWTVLSIDATSTILQLSRLTGETYEGASEAVLCTANTQIQIFSAAGVQVGEYVDISAGFSTPVLQAYSIDKINPSWFEVLATGTLPVAQVAIPGTSGIAFYNSAKKLLFMEADQECAIQLNGATGSFDRISPWVSGDVDNTATFMKVGPTWSCTVVNRSSVALNITVLTAE